MSVCFCRRGWSYRHCLLGHGNVEAVRLLLLAGADQNSTDHAGRNALMLASRFAHTKVVCLLLENRADPNSTSFDGHTALMLGNSNRLAGSEVARLLPAVLC